jgi:GTPase SAR1 family protein
MGNLFGRAREGNKWIFVGDTGVGKTCFLRNIPEAEPTTGVDFTRHNDVFVWELSGDERFRDIIKSYVDGATSVFYMFNNENLESFNSIETRWIPFIQRNLQHYNHQIRRFYLIENNFGGPRVVENGMIMEMCERFGLIHRIANQGIFNELM